MLIAIGMFKIYDIPIYTARDNLYGICLLIFMYGFAMIPMVHLGEKLFHDASMANMYILCLNIIIALTCITVIILFDVLGDSDVSRILIYRSIWLHMFNFCHIFSLGIRIYAKRPKSNFPNIPSTCLHRRFT